MPTIKAKIVMEAKGTAPAVRGHNFQSQWSRLYQAKDYYLDVMLKPAMTSSSVLGQLLSGEEVTLEGVVQLSREASTVSETHLSEEADFTLRVNEAGAYKLRIILQEDTIDVDDLDID